MKQKLIFLDIDGTLLPPGEMLIPQSTVEALHKAHANGHKLFLCTGRNLRMTQPLLDYGFDGAVCSAGGYVFCGDKVLVDLPMEPQLAQGVRSAMERHGVECTLEARDATYGSLKMIERWSFTHRDAGNLNSCIRSCISQSTARTWTKQSSCMRTDSCSARASWTVWTAAM